MSHYLYLVHSYICNSSFSMRDWTNWSMTNICAWQWTCKYVFIILSFYMNTFFNLQVSNDATMGKIMFKQYVRPVPRRTLHTRILQNFMNSSSPCVWRLVPTSYDRSTQILTATHPDKENKKGKIQSQWVIFNAKREGCTA